MRSIPLFLKMSPETLEARLGVRKGPLADILPLFDLGTLKEAHGIMDSRRSMPEIRAESLWAADFPMYRVEDGEAFLYFAPRENNLIFRDVENATNQLLDPGKYNYFPPQEGINEVVAAAAAGKALKIKISDLQLQNQDSEHGFFDVNPDDLDLLNKPQRQLVNAIYGTSRTGTRVYVLNSEYVKETLKGREGSAIARVSGLGGADVGPGPLFTACGRGVGDSVGLLGVLKVEYTPRGIIDYLAKNPVKDPGLAVALLNSANAFYQSQKQ